MLGFSDPAIGWIYLLNIAAVLLCAVYGFIKWNSNDDDDKGDSKKGEK